MDNLTHTLTGVALSRAGLNRLTPQATAILILASSAPDVDVVSRFASVINYLEHHRGITHSFAATPALAVLVAGLFWLGNRARPGRGGFRFRPALLVAWIGVMGHALMDFSTSYGTRLLLPFSSRWLAWDIMPILDIWLLAFLVAGLVLPFLFRMISEEIGAQRGSNRPGAIFALAALLVWWGVRDFAHRRAVTMLDSHVYHGREPRRLRAFPDFVNPFLWHGVVDTGSSFETAAVNIFGEFDPTRTRTYYQPDPQPALEAAWNTGTARIFLDFAAFPFTYVDRREDGYEVVFRDLRFDSNAVSPHGFVARVIMDERFQVLRESFHFRDPGPVR